jgi:hypothetical protein
LGVLRLWRKLEQRRCNLEAGLWNKHHDDDDDDDDDSIWEFKIVEQTRINMMMEFGS